MTADGLKLSLGVVGTGMSWFLEYVAPVAAPLASLATVAFLSTCIAEKFGLLERFKPRKK